MGCFSGGDVLGVTVRKIASLDLGSNTFLMLIATVDGGQIKEVFVDESEVVRLGQGIHQNKKFHFEALIRAENCLKNYAALIKNHGVDKVVAVATSAARDAVNKEELLSMGRGLGIPITIISGDEEALLTYKGSTFDLNQIAGSTHNTREYAVIDIGGGSTEILGLDKNGNVCGCSLDIGSVRLTEMFLHHDPITEGEMGEMDKYIDKCLQEKSSLFPKAKKLVAVAGTPTTLSAVVQGIEFDEHRIHGHMLALDQVMGYRGVLGAQSLALRKQVKGMDSRRADVIVAGISILGKFIQFLGVKEILVSTKGIRYGLALSPLGD